MVLLLATFSFVLTVSSASALATAPPGDALLAQDGEQDGELEGLDEVGDVDFDDVESTVEILPLSGFLDPPTSAQIRDVLELADEQGSILVVLQLDGAGAVSADTQELVELIEGSPVPVAVLVGPLGTGPQVAGGLAALWLSADVRAAVLDATVGPLQPLDLADEGADAGALLAQVQRDGEDAGSLLDDAVAAEQLVDAGVADLMVPSLEALLLELDGATVAGQELVIEGGEVGVRFHSLGLVRRMLHAATTAPFIYLLLTVGLGMLLFEVFQPGFGVAGLAGIITAGIGAFGLWVLPVTWWAVALVILGLLLYAVDTAVAGFGPITLAASAAFVVGSLNFYDAQALQLPVWLVVLVTLTVASFFVFVMTVILRAQAGPDGVQVDELVGRAGIVRSVLNPEGHVYLDGALWRARWTGESKRAKVGTPVRVHAVDGPVVLVEPFDPDGKVAQGATSGSGPGEA